MTKLLLVEDDRGIVSNLTEFLNREGYSVKSAPGQSGAMELLQKEHFDLALLDISLADGNGFAACRAIKGEYHIPVIFLTASGDEYSTVTGFELGADDYVTKPFTLSVLYAKTMALIKRSRGQIRSGDVLEVSGIRLELSSQKAFADGRELNLTPKEYALLRVLMLNRNIVMSREQLLVKCWGYDYEGESRAVDTHIRRLRDKLGDRAECIKTVIKAGYRLEGSA